MFAVVDFLNWVFLLLLLLFNLQYWLFFHIISPLKILRRKLRYPQLRILYIIISFVLFLLRRLRIQIMSTLYGLLLHNPIRKLWKLRLKLHLITMLRCKTPNLLSISIIIIAAIKDVSLWGFLIMERYCWH